jgi:hypothetical protein
MRAIEAEYGIRDFNLVHDMFTVDAKRVRAFCTAMMESGQGYTWACSARTDSVDEELIERMAEAGCRGMFFGVETGSEKMQKIIDKHLDTRRAHEIIDIVERAGIHSTVSLIAGFPQENWDDVRETVGMFMHSARVSGSGPQLNLLAPLANTPLHLQYREQMTLDMLCSDMSHQGRKQHPEDMELIRDHPDIFPNFYLLPTPEMDRRKLLELREFTLMAELRFRWLLGAADQAATGILDIFFDWVDRREALYPGLAGAELRHYYRTPVFTTDFIAFLRSHAAGENQLLQVFLEFEQAVNGAESPDSPKLSGGLPREAGETLDWSDIPIRTCQSRVIGLSRELDQAIEAVKSRRAPAWEPGRQWYVVAQVPGKASPVYHVSPRIAKAVEACNGRRTMRQLVSRLAMELPEVPEYLQDYTFVTLVEKAWTDGLVAIYRSASDAAGSQGAEFSTPEYSEMSAAASLQNQSAIHAV